MAVKKAKAKQWYLIVAPKIFGGREIGKTVTGNPEKIIGRRITVPAYEISNDYSKFYLKFKFRISELNGTTATTVFDGMEAMRDYISRMILRRVRRVDTIQDLATKDGLKLRVKGLTVISRRVKTSIEKKVRERVMEMITHFVESNNLEDLVEKILSEELKNRILQEIRRIYPVRNFEFRRIDVLKK